MQDESGANARRFEHPFERKIAERIGLYELTDLFDGHLRGDQVGLVRRVHAVIARAKSSAGN